MNRKNNIKYYFFLKKLKRIALVVLIFILFFLLFYNYSAIESYVKKFYQKNLENRNVCDKVIIYCN